MQPLELGAVRFQDIFDLRKHGIFSSTSTILGVVLLHGRWQVDHPNQYLLNYWTKHSLAQIQATVFNSSIAINPDEDLEFCLESYCSLPSELPALMVIVQTATMEHSQPTFLRQIHPATLQQSTHNSTTARQVLCSLTKHVDSILDTHPTITVQQQQQPLRLFVAGDRSSVGKSSICLGLVATALRLGYCPPEAVAYIKPATQSEAPSLVAQYCAAHGIASVPIGPLVYYRGFTRAFLAQPSSHDSYLQACARAVDRLGRGKRLVILDGVGFPAVGSICGTSNAAVADACQVQGVLMVGGPGVGGAVDAYNLNAQYFRGQAPHLRVLGAVFNQLKAGDDDYYSLSKCREQVRSYFRQYRPEEQAFGFVPKCRGGLSMSNVDAFIDTFASHVDVVGILAALGASSSQSISSDNTTTTTTKRRKTSSALLSREEIEQAAIAAGAAPSA